MPNKAVGATTGVGLAGAVTTLVIALLWPTADATSAAARTTVFSAALAFIGAYLPKMEN